MDGGSGNQGENHDENINNDANDRENSGPSTRSQGTGTVPSFDIAAFTVSFPPGPEPDELVSVNEDTEGREEKTAVCCLCFHYNCKLYTIPPQNRASFQELLKNVTNADGGQGVSVPHCVCWDCNDTLTSMTAFRTRAIQTNSLLYSLIRPFINVSEQSTSAPEGSGIPATPRCTHRHHGSHTHPYNNSSDENNSGRPGRLSFCVLQRSRNPPQPQGQEE